MPTGTTGNDALLGTLGNDTYDALAGNDTITGSDGTDTVDGGEGRDTLVLNVTNSLDYTAPSGPRTYVLTASSFTDGFTINTSFTGIERVTFSSFAHNFDVTVDASAWAPAPSTSTNVNSFNFSVGNDTFIGSAFRDSITPGMGINVINGGAGTDQVTQRIDNGGGTVTVSSSGATTTISQGSFFTTTITNVEFIYVGNSSTTDGNQNIDASAATVSVIFYDGSGDDVFVGGTNNDLFANVGAAGYSIGNDTYTGGGGADIYDFTFAMQGFDGTTITDFDEDDYIDLNFNLPANGAAYLVNNFIGTAAFSGTAGEYRYETGGGQTLVQFDSNGDGVADGTLTIANGEFDLQQYDNGGIHGLRIDTGAIVGTAGSDTLSGTAGNDVIEALNGDDFIFGSGGTDTVDGGFNVDQLIYAFASGVSPGFTQVSGNRAITIGTSTITDSAGQIATTFYNMESIQMQSSAVSFVGFSTGTTTIDASAFAGALGVTILNSLGTDDVILTGSAQSDNIVVGQGNHQLNGGGGGNDLLNIGYYNSLVASGTNANMTITSGAYSSTAINFETVTLGLIGGTGTVDASGMTTGVDIRGGTGQTLIGGSGNDFFANHFSGGTNLGPTELTGGAGADTYSYSSFGDNFDDDHILDFTSEDIISLQQVALFGVDPVFIGNAAFTGVVNQVRYQKSGGTTLIQVDTNGDGVADDTLTIENGAFDLYEFAPFQFKIAPPGLTLNGTPTGDILNGASFVDTLSGLAGNDTLYGFAMDDILNGGDGDDLLIGGTGADAMTGGTGNDTYNVDDVGDQVIELGGQGTDMVQVELLTYTLGANVENMFYSGSGNFNGVGNNLINHLIGSVGNDTLSALNGDDRLSGLDGNDSLLGGAGNDTLEGGAGDDYLDGGTGVDIMSGTAGNDTYVVNLATDVVNELTNQGTDSIVSSIVWTLANHVENLTLSGGAAINGTGNGAANVITGNTGANTLIGLGGNDTLIGGAGNDRLIGGAGSDAVSGGTGNDIYQITDTTDTVTEGAGEGTDLIQAYVNYALGDNVENLYLYGSAQIGIGNELGNTVRGTTAANTLYGMAGNDFMYGGAGDDLIFGGAGRDQFFGEAGADMFLFSDGDFSGVTAGTADLIRDFSLIDGDRINLSFVDAIVGGSDNGFYFMESLAFGNRAGELRFETSATTTTVMGDTDGDGVADFWIVISGVHALEIGDFVL